VRQDRPKGTIENRFSRATDLSDQCYLEFLDCFSNLSEIHERALKRNGITMTNAEVHVEGPVARSLEYQTAKVPSDLFLWAAVGSIVASLLLKAIQKKHDSLFIGQWAPTFLLLGIYNKLVKQHGSDRVDRTPLS
jgi:hypothetical protein